LPYCILFCLQFFDDYDAYLSHCLLEFLNIPYIGYHLHAPGSGNRKTTKFDTIVKNLKEVLAEKQNDGFELFITGHSLGGALCQLLSYELTAYNEKDENDPFPLPIRAISFASPHIGNEEGFAQAYQALEKAGRVRHLRVTNEGALSWKPLSVLVTLKLE
jgi:surfactin synthase thioesterase subunit